MTLARETLTRQAFDALVKHIVDKGLRPGEPLPSTSALTEEFGISRPIVREALSALQACGFVDLRSGRNPVVGELDGRLIEMFVSRAARTQEFPMSALMEVRAPLEVQAAGLAAERADPAFLERLQSMSTSMESSLRDASRYPALDVAFHADIARASNNSILVWMIESIRSQLMSVMVAVRHYREENGLIGQEQEEHDAIFAAIRAGSPQEARVAMERHLAMSMTLVRHVEQKSKLPVLSTPATDSPEAS